jgi:hypothetical protein
LNHEDREEQFIKDREYDEDEIFQKCYGVVHWHHRREMARRENDEGKIEAADRIFRELIGELKRIFVEEKNNEHLDKPE